MENGIVSRKSARTAYDAIKIYLEIFGNKEEPFMEEHLKLLDYNVKNLRRLQERGFIDVAYKVRDSCHNYKNVYKLCEGVLKFPLEEILDMSCYDMERKIYRQSEEGKAYMKRAQQKYIRSEKGKATEKKYKASEKGKATEKKYRKSEVGKAVIKKYQQSEKGKVAARKAEKKYLSSGKYRVGKEIRSEKIMGIGYLDVYKLSEGVLKFPLEEILDMSYDDMGENYESELNIFEEE